jgi:putative MATE family efflux protein
MAIDIHKRGDLYNVFWIAWPQALSMLVMTIQAMVDMFWIGRLGTAEVAAVAVVGNVINVIFGFAGFLLIGTVAIMSRAFGAGEHSAASRVLVHSMLLGVFTGVLLLVLGWVFAPELLDFFEVEPEVAGHGVVYFRIMSVHLALVMVLLAPMAGFNSAGDTFTPLVINVIAVLANVVLDPIFIFSPDRTMEIGGFTFHPGLFGWGVFGAGMASVIVTVLAGGLFLVTVPLGRFPVKVPRIREITLELFEFWRIIKIGVPFAVAHMSRPLSTVLLLKIIAEFGTGPVAGFGISMRWYHVNWILVSGMGTAASVLVGQYLGAQSPEGASRVSRRLILASFGIQIISTALYFYFASAMVALMDPNPLTVEPGVGFMCWVVAGFLLSTPGGLAAAAMNGAGDTKPGMVAGVVSNWAIKLPLAWALARVPFLGLDGVWIGMFVSLIAEGAICLLWYRFGGWRQKVLSRDGSRPL